MEIMNFFIPNEICKRIIYSLVIAVLVILAITFNFFIREQENKAKQKELEKHLEHAKILLQKQ